MTKLVAANYRIVSRSDGKSAIEFSDPTRTLEVEFPTVALMGLAHSLRKVAHEAQIPLTRHRTTGQMRLTGPQLPPLSRTGGNMSQGSQFGVNISADFEVLTTWFNIPNTEGSGSTTFEASLTLEDSEKLAENLATAIAIAKRKPAAPAGGVTQH
jgi:hypothetical protein